MVLLIVTPLVKVTNSKVFINFKKTHNFAFCNFNFPVNIIRCVVSSPKTTLIKDTHQPLLLILFLPVNIINALHLIYLQR